METYRKFILFKIYYSKKKKYILILKKKKEDVKNGGFDVSEWEVEKITGFGGLKLCHIRSRFLL